jgi:hypothetical protein
MANSENVITIPQAPADAYNTNRPVSELLWMQVEHLAAVVKKDIDDERRAIRTEGDASAFIKKYTAFLNPRIARKKATASSSGARKEATGSARGGARKKPAPSSRGAKKKPARSSKK